MDKYTYMYRQTPMHVRLVYARFSRGNVTNGGKGFRYEFDLISKVIRLDGKFINIVQRALFAATLLIARNDLVNRPRLR